MIGQRIGNYVITSLLQEGGMGTVYIAEHPEIGRRVAIKLISSGFNEASGIAERFLAEAKAITRIEHPNIIDIYDFGRTESGQLYYTMELLKGRELASVMAAAGPMSPAEVLPYLNQVCSALQAAHESGVIHRDLKPENIFVLDRPQITIKLLDFGLAKLTGGEPGKTRPSLTQTGMVMGTPYTIAPEQAAGRSNLIGPQTDIYSLGVVLYWLLVGYPPFTGEATPLILAQHIKEPPRPILDIDPTIPIEVAAVVERCLAKKPEDRPPSATSVAADFAKGVDFDKAVVATSGAPSAASNEPDCAAGSPHRWIEPMGHRATKAGLGPAIVPNRAHSEEDASTPVAGRPADPKAEGAGNSGTVTAELKRGGFPFLPEWWLWAAVGVAFLGLGTMLTLIIADGDDGKGVAHEKARQQSKTIPKTVLGLRETRSPPQKPKSPPPAIAASDATPSDAPSRPSRTRQVVVTANDFGATCHIRIDGAEARVQQVPCYLQVSVGQQVGLEVTREGYAPFSRRWRVTRNEVISLTVSEDAQRIFWPDARSDTRRARPARVKRGKVPTTSRSAKQRKRQKRDENRDQDQGKARKSAPELGGGTMAF